MKNKIIFSSALLLISSLSNADDIKPIIGLDLGFEGGTITTDYSAPGYIPASYEHDYSGANFRLSGGIEIEHESLQSRIKAFYESASGEVEFDSSLAISDEDYDSTEYGLSYDLIIPQEEGVEPFFGVEIGVGSSEFDIPNADETDYISFGLYAGLLYSINDNIDLSARLGYKSRSYEDYSEYAPLLGAVVTEEVEYSGLDLKVGLTYMF